MSTTPSPHNDYEALQSRGMYAQPMQVRAATWDAQTNSIEAVITTERAVQMFDWNTGSVVDEILRADGLQLTPAAQVPLLDSHARWSIDTVLGSARNIVREGAKIVGRLYMADVPSNAETIAKLRGGHISDVSAGYVNVEAQTIRAGETQEIGGQRYTATKRSLRVVTKWELREVSLVPIGADASAKLRAENPREKKHMETVQSVVVESTSAAAPAGNVNDASRAAAPSVEQLQEAARQALAQDKVRRAAVRAAAKDLDLPPEIVDRAVDEMTVDQARTAFLEHIRTARSPGVAPNAIVRSNELTREALVHGLCMQVGCIEKKMTDQQREEGDRARNMSVREIAAHALRMDRVDPSGMGRIEVLERAASTITLPTILGAVANKAMIAGYDDAPSTALQWMGVTDLPNFQTAKRGRLADLTPLTKLNNGGEIPSLTVSEWFESIQVDSYAGLIHFTRQDMYNDDLGAFADMGPKCGSRAKAKVDDVAYTVLLSNPTLASDSIALFVTTTTTHNNLTSGGTSTLSDATLATLKQKMREQKDVNGNQLNIEAAKLIVPPALEHTALKLLLSPQVLRSGGSTSTAEQYGTYNVWQNALGSPIVEPRLANSAYTGYSATAFYLACNPTRGNHMMLAFLAGTNRAPLITQVQPSANQTGMVWQVIMDVGAAAIDFRGIQKSAGA